MTLCPTNRPTFYLPAICNAEAPMEPIAAHRKLSEGSFVVCCLIALAIAPSVFSAGLLCVPTPRTVAVVLVHRNPLYPIGICFLQLCQQCHAFGFGQSRRINKPSEQEGLTISRGELGRVL